MTFQTVEIVNGKQIFYTWTSYAEFLAHIQRLKDEAARSVTQSRSNSQEDRDAGSASAKNAKRIPRSKKAKKGRPGPKVTLSKSDNSNKPRRRRRHVSPALESSVQKTLVPVSEGVPEETAAALAPESSGRRTRSAARGPKKPAPVRPPTKFDKRSDKARQNWLKRRSDPELFEQFRERCRESARKMWIRRHATTPSAKAKVTDTPPKLKKRRERKTTDVAMIVQSDCDNIEPTEAGSTGLDQVSGMSGGTGYDVNAALQGVSSAGPSTNMAESNGGNKVIDPERKRTAGLRGQGFASVTNDLSRCSSTESLPAIPDTLEFVHDGLSGDSWQPYYHSSTSAVASKWEEGSFCHLTFPDGYNTAGTSQDEFSVDTTHVEPGSR